MRILIVEDDNELRRQLVDTMSEAGYVIDATGDGEDGQFLGDTEPYDLAILDIGLPTINGLDVLESWRASGRNFPVLLLTARDRWSDKVAGIDAGADDYLAKPFHIEELLARVRGLIRRSTGHASSTLQCGEIELDTNSSKVTVSGASVKLTSFEYRLLTQLMLHPNTVVSRSTLIEKLYAQDFDKDSNTIEVFIGRLRRKLGIKNLETVRGLGYRLACPEEKLKLDK